MGKTIARVRSLDALRGLAALAVVIHHWSLAFLGPARSVGGNASLGARLVADLQAFIPKVLETGEAAVIIFFVLSGFVLALSLEADGDNYAQFMLKRVCRIMPPLALAVLLSAVLYLIVDPYFVSGVNSWFNNAGWTTRPDIALVLGHWGLINQPRFVSLDSVIWTLRHEMRISIFFPFIAYCVRHRPVVSLISSFVVSATAAFLTRYVTGSLGDWLVTVLFSFLFFWGAGIAQHRVQIRKWIMRRRRIKRFVSLGFCIALLVFSPSSLKGQYLLYLGAIGLVALCAADTVLIRSLEQRPLLYLGKISYSLYLVHVPIMLAMVHQFYGVWPSWMLICTGFAVTLIMAEIFNRLVEKPSQYVGRLAAMAVERWRREPNRNSSRC